jgi:hypothetical protein
VIFGVRIRLGMTSCNSQYQSGRKLQAASPPFVPLAIAVVFA